MFTIDLELDGTQTACNRVVNMILSDSYENALSHIAMTGSQDNTHLELIADVASTTRDLLLNEGIIPSPIVEYGLTGELTAIDNFFASTTHTKFESNNTDDKSHIGKKSWELHGIDLDLSIRKHTDEA